MFAYLLLGPEELESFTAGSPDNTDDNARIEFSAPRDLLGYAKFDPYLAKVYGPLWPYGRLSEVIVGLRRARSQRQGGQLARSLLAHGKSREAELWTRRAEAAGDGARGASTRACCWIWCRRGSTAIPRSRSRLRDGLAPPVVPAKLAAAQPALVERVAAEYPQILASAAARRTRPPTTC